MARERTADGSKRLSNPFDDDKSISSTNLFDSIPEPKHPSVAVSRVRPNPTKPVVEHGDSEKAFYPIYLDDRLGAPGAEKQGYNFPLYASEKEPDDDIHMPMIDDDKTMRAHWKEHFNRDTFVTTLGLICMVVGLLSLFIVLPVLSATGVDILGNDGYETPLDQMWGSTGSANIPVTWATINNSRTWPLLQNLRTGLIDPDTPKSAYTRTALDGSEYKLVFSDEFSDPNRTFYPGDDPYFFAPDIWYGATQDLEWYSPDAVTTWEGSLELRLDAFENNDVQYRSGMLNSWNQLCFKGGIYEVSVSLPGPGGAHGLWPGVWSMGNLGRPGYLATSEGMWPYTYNDCDAGITPNQSSPDGINYLPGQRLTSCGCAGEDHPTPGTGRGAPEIDIIEVSAMWGGQNIAVATQSFQVAPFDIWWFPDYEFMETPNYGTSFVNSYTGGPYQQAVSTTTMLNNSWFDGIMYQQYAYEYTPGAEANSSIAWWVGDEMVMRFDARALRPNGNIGQRLISEEPMSLVMNLGLSHSWVSVDFASLRFPTIMRIDYVRWYQKEGEELVTCDPPGYETTEYIKKHPEAYNNPNYTRWTDIPGYTWPKNTLMNEC
ncbi:beta-glucan synthesis-associated [Delphinella strobiligena]|nr:beta-glucan synthesis-associated [Delphinella strobiligena]